MAQNAIAVTDDETPKISVEINPTLRAGRQGAVAVGVLMPAAAEDRAAPPPPEDMIPATLSVRIPGAATTRTSLLLRPGLGLGEWGRIGQFLLAFGSVTQWWIGDWLNFGKRAFGSKYSQAVDESQGKTWRNYAWVASRFEPSRRRDNLTWSVHAEIASIKSEADRHWVLDIAAKNNWTARVARGAVRRYNYRPPFPAANRIPVMDRADQTYGNALLYAHHGLEILRRDLPPGALKCDLLADAEDVERRLREFADRIRE